ncbi:molybdopterin synthase subunit MoaD2 [Mycobacterium tuberculosis]|uniref:molybdopterin synthase subunit MoaD2 n=1 Tax=Mycobacterium tuberculosis TaxID=1773 RepID=UPI000A342664|nr:molybdopterin synthase subunit MoaD2 [Mycobacterium tuberculosis]
MTQVSDESAGIQVTVRYFAAAGAGSEKVTLRSGATVAELIDGLSVRDVRLATVLSRCSYLRDGIVVRDDAVALSAGDTIDVLPPFAGG